MRCVEAVGCCAPQKRIQKWFCVQALPPSLLSALAQIVPAERCFSCGNCVPENRLFLCWIHRPIEAGQLEVDGTGFYGSTLDESFF
jgi:hypothetical protein